MHLRPRSTRLLGCFVALLVLASVATLKAYVADGTKWPGTTAVPGSIPMQLALGARVPTVDDPSTSWNTVAQGALTSWSSNLGNVQFVGANGSIPAAPAPNGANNVFFSSTVYGSAFGANVLAVTLSYTIGSTRVECDVLFNSAMTWDSYSGAVRFVSGMRHDDLRRVALHEFGHVLGLNHPDQSGQSVAAVMNSTISNLGELSADDIAGGQFIYGGGTPTAPTISSHPANQILTAGGTANFSVIAAGSPPFTYQWRKETNPLIGSTNATLTLTNVQAINAGNYSVVVSNSVNSVTSNAASLTVNPVPVAPHITTQPTSQSATTGATVILFVTATGTPTPTYQWRKDNSPLSGETGTSLTLPGVTFAQAGTYTVVVTNSAATIISNPAVLTIIAGTTGPSIQTQPQSRTVATGASVTFSVTATGNPSPTYQWRKDGVPLSGATNASFTISSATTLESGIYSVVVTNTVGTATSNGAGLTVLDPPYLSSQPISQSASAGSGFSLIVVASGSNPLTYQWRKNGSIVLGAATSVLSFPLLQVTDAGIYIVTVSNSVGTVTSTPATLTVTPAPFAPVIQVPPVSRIVAEGGTTTFTVTAIGEPAPTYQWRKDGQTLVGMTGTSLVLSNVTRTQAGDYTVSVTNSLGTRTSSPATLTVTVPPEIVVSPQSVSAVEGTGASFSVIATGTGPLTYQWLKAGIAIPNAADSTLSLTELTTAHAGAYSVTVKNALGSVTSSVAILTILPATAAPVIVVQPISKTAVAGTSVTFSVTATGLPPPTYQWRNAGVTIPGATSSTFTLPNVSIASAGSFNVVVTNSIGVATSESVTLTVITPPFISTPPAAQSAAVGTNVVLHVVAGGSNPLSYQWRKNNLPVANAVEATLTLANVQLTDAGSYSVVVTNVAGSTTSELAAVTITPANFAPIIASHPLSQVVSAGSTVQFSVVANGLPLPTYQWLNNNVPVANATSTSLSVTSVTSSDEGKYSVVVTNLLGSVTSSAATLTVLNPPRIQTPPADQFATIGANATFSVVATGSPPLAFEWKHEGTVIAGATATTLTISSTTLTDGGAYTVTVSNSAGSETSAPATLTFTPESRLVNLSVRAEAGSGGRTLIVGFVSQGTAAKQLLIRGSGPALIPFGVGHVLADPNLEIYQSGVRLGQNDDWPETPAMIDAFTRVGAFAFATHSKDAAILTSLTPGSYSALLSGATDSTGASLVEVYDTDGETSASKLSNLSVLNFAGTGDSALIVGFVIRGTAPQTLLIRAVGPSLASFGVPGTLADPILELYSGSTLIAQNGDWGGSPALTNTFTKVGAFNLPATSKDAALVVTLQPGAYSARVAGADSGTGIAILEVYDVP